MAPQLAWVLACAFLWVVVASSNEQHLPSHLLIKREFFPAENKALQQVSYRQILYKSPVICVSYCHSDPNCQSVNYHTSSHLCQLNNVTRTQYPDDFKTLYGSLYFDASSTTSLLSTLPSTKSLSTTPFSSELIKTSSADPTALLTALLNPTTVSRPYTSLSSAINEVTSSATTAVTTVQPKEHTEQTKLTETTRTPLQKAFSTPSTTTTSPVTTEPLHLTSCQKLLEAGIVDSGVYTIYPDRFSDGLEVYCDMETDGGGWIVIQRRQDGSVNFNLNWAEYRDGFGDLTTEFWLGNENIRILTEFAASWTLRVDLMDWDGLTVWAKYSGFQTTGSNYNLEYSSFDLKSTAGDALEVHRGRQFSTPDRDNDGYRDINCAVKHKAGWWYNYCHQALLNGQYYFPGQFITGYGIQWDTWRDDPYSLKECSMKIRNTLG